MQVKEEKQLPKPRSPIKDSNMDGGPSKNEKPHSEKEFLSEIDFKADFKIDHEIVIDQSENLKNQEKHLHGAHRDRDLPGDSESIQTCDEFDDNLKDPGAEGKASKAKERSTKIIPEAKYLRTRIESGTQGVGDGLNSQGSRNACKGTSRQAKEGKKKGKMNVEHVHLTSVDFEKSLPDEEGL